MIIAFADDKTVQVFDITQANTYCEGIDVEDGVYIFYDEFGQRYEPEFTIPNKKSSLGPIGTVVSGIFTLKPSGPRDLESLQTRLKEVVALDKGPTDIKTLDQLRDFLKHSNQK